MVGSFNQKAAAPPEELKNRFLDAVEKDDRGVVGDLLAKHPDALGWENSAGSNALDIAMIYHKVDLAKWLIDKGSDINHRDHDGWTPLIRACDKDHPALVEILIAKGADLEKRIISSEMTPLLVAGMMGRTACAELLLKAGASTDAEDNGGKTALRWAKGKGTEAVIRNFINEREKKIQAEAAEKAALTAELEGMSAKGIDTDLRVRRPLTLNIKN